MHCFCFVMILLTCTSVWLMIGMIPVVAAGILGGSGLFSVQDDLEILTSNNFKTFMAEFESAKLVLFYAEWCGHCQRFAPVFKEFATEVAGWHKAIDIGVVNCADSVNTELCRDQNIMSYPNLQLYWIEQGGKGSTKGEVIDARTPIDLEKEIIRFIEKKVKAHGEPHPDYVKLDPSSATTIDEIWGLMKPEVKQVFVVVEDAESYTGRQLILDFSAITNGAAVRYLRGNGPEEVRNQDSVSLVMLERGVHPRVLITEPEPKKARALFKKQLIEFGYIFEKDRNVRPTTEKPHHEIGDYSKVYLVDLESGLYNTLWTEIALKHDITSNQLSILKNFFMVIRDNIDLPDRIKMYLTNLVNTIDDSNKITGKDYTKLLKAVPTPQAFLYENTTYNGCRGSVDGLRGYTCSLWTMFHYATVGSHARYLRNEIPDPNYAIRIIREYVVNFFTCEECRSHFEAMSKNLDAELKTPDDSVLWLWRGHNKVNARLQGDNTEDPLRPKVQFPPKTLCEECHHGDAFDEAAVLRFLHSFYNYSNMIMSIDPNYPATTEKYTDSSNTK